MGKKPRVSEADMKQAVWRLRLRTSLFAQLAMGLPECTLKLTRSDARMLLQDLEVAFPKTRRGRPIDQHKKRLMAAAVDEVLALCAASPEREKQIKAEVAQRTGVSADSLIAAVTQRRKLICIVKSNADQMRKSFMERRRRRSVD